MVQKKRKNSSGHYKSTSKQVRDATLGTHVSHESRSSNHTNADSLDFTNSRKSQRANNGYVDAFIPETTSRETEARYSRRMGQREYMKAAQRRSRVRTIVTIVVVCLVAVLIAVVVGLAVFLGVTNSSFSLTDSDASTVLVDAEEDEAFYVVVAADLDTASMGNADEGPDAFALVRIDAASQQVSIFSIPLSTQATLEDGSEGDLRELAVEDGDAALISAIAEMAGVEVSHYVEIDGDEIVALVDALGGIEVEVPEVVDDPTAGDEYLEAGVQALDGESTLTLLRASNYSDPIETQCESQRAVLSAVSVALLESLSGDYLSIFGDFSGLFHSDMGIFAYSLVESLSGLGEDAVEGTLAPGSESTDDDGEDCYTVSTSDFESLIEQVEAGESIEDATETVELVDPASFTITVRNGSGVTGAASQIASELEELGFVVESTGNADSFVYTETLVIYKYDEYEAAAETVVESLGVGRVVDGGDYYSFDTDVLVVVGDDWTPTS